MTFCVLWMIVPIILFGLIVLASSIVSRTAEGEHRLSVRAGFWAGLVGFVAFVVYEMDSFNIPDFTKAMSIHLNILHFLLAMGFGYFMLYVMKQFVPTRLGGFVVLLLVFTGSTSLFSYFFVQVINDELLSTSLGAALGVLLHMLVSPKYVYVIFSKPTKKPDDSRKESTA
jgi:hypothetical protein